MIRWMSGQRSDVIVVGLGAMGAALAWRLATRGVRVVGLDRYHPPHALGSTHGRSRIIREAYYEHPHYVPIVQRAFGLWAELEAESRTRLYQATGGLMIGPADGPLVSGARTSAARHGVPVQVWSRDELAARVPALTPPADAIGLFEPRAGVLDPERACLGAAVAARPRGAPICDSTRPSRASKSATTAWSCALWLASDSSRTARARRRRLDDARCCRIWRCHWSLSARCSTGFTPAGDARYSAGGAADLPARGA